MLASLHPTPWHTFAEQSEILPRTPCCTLGPLTLTGQLCHPCRDCRTQTSNSITVQEYCCLRCAMHRTGPCSQDMAGRGGLDLLHWLHTSHVCGGTDIVALSGPPRCSKFDPCSYHHGLQEFCWSSRGFPIDCAVTHCLTMSYML